MPRKINARLMARLINGDLQPLLQYVKQNSEQLRLESRMNGKAFVYYRKCKVLELGVNSYKIDAKYFPNEKILDDIPEKVINQPAEYFGNVLPVVDSWLKLHKKNEFDCQQKIAYNNQSADDRFIILDMEYNFSQKEISPNDRIKKAGFDLLGIERNSGNIVFFEVKKGRKALSYKSGISAHIADFKDCLFGKHSPLFHRNLITDIENIIDDKKKLGIISNFEIPKDLHKKAIELVFVFEPVGPDDLNHYKKKSDAAIKELSLNKPLETIYIINGKYKLK